MFEVNVPLTVASDTLMSNNCRNAILYNAGYAECTDKSKYVFVLVSKNWHCNLNSMAVSRDYNLRLISAVL